MANNKLQSLQETLRDLKHHKSLHLQSIRKSGPADFRSGEAGFLILAIEHNSEAILRSAIERCESMIRQEATEMARQAIEVLGRDTKD